MKFVWYEIRVVTNSICSEIIDYILQHFAIEIYDFLKHNFENLEKFQEDEIT